MDCKTCKERDATNVSRGLFESVLARMDRTIKRLWIVVLFLIFLFVGTNIYWIWFTSQFERVETTQTVNQDADNGINRFIGGNYYGSEADWGEEGSGPIVFEDADNDEEGNTDGNHDNEEVGP